MASVEENTGRYLSDSLDWAHWGDRPGYWEVPWGNNLHGSWDIHKWYIKEVQVQYCMKPEVTMGQIARRDTVMISPVQQE